MKLIVGLGNPGKEYQHTRHNVGFDILDIFAKENNWTITQKKFQALYTEGLRKHKKLILLKPQTYMNLSGESVSAAIHFYKIPIDSIIVIHDDLDLPPGEVRFRQQGSAGGHNGLKSIIQHLGGDNFSRIKVGIGKPSSREHTSKHVLEKFSAEEKLLLESAFDKALEKLENWLDV